MGVLNVSFFFYLGARERSCDSRRRPATATPRLAAAGARTARRSDGVDASGACLCLLELNLPAASWNVLNLDLVHQSSLVEDLAIRSNFKRRNICMSSQSRTDLGQTEGLAFCKYNPKHKTSQMWYEPEEAICMYDH